MNFKKNRSRVFQRNLPVNAIKYGVIPEEISGENTTLASEGLSDV